MPIRYTNYQTYLLTHAILWPFAHSIFILYRMCRCHRRAVCSLISFSFFSFRHFPNDIKLFEQSVVFLCSLLLCWTLFCSSFFFSVVFSLVCQLIWLYYTHFCLRLLFIHDIDSVEKYGSSFPFHMVFPFAFFSSNLCGAVRTSEWARSRANMPNSKSFY